MRGAVRRAAAAVTVLALLLSACSGDDGRDADGTIRLRFQSLAWQRESVDANKRLVKEWNAAHPAVQVEYVQGSWDSVHDQLLTSFEGGEAPDIIHDASDDLADFAYGATSPTSAPTCPPGSRPTSPSGPGAPPRSARASTGCPSSRSPGS